jgi:hypothetical protein
MKSATLRATILAVTLLLSGAVTVGVAANDGAPTQKQTNGTPVAITQQNASAEATDDGAGLSTLGVLALGIIGLLWARRHVAEL